MSRDLPRIAFAATNPCHLWDMACALARISCPVTYYSGYPKWKLEVPDSLQFHELSWRTLVTYALYRLPERFRPADRVLFKWQDRGFDRAVASRRLAAEFLHGLPGQCRDTLRAAHNRGIRCVLNHASGPIRQQLALVRPEYERRGMRNPDEDLFDRAYFQRELEEYQLADYHCVASSVVRDQLVAEGFEADHIWVVPYGANPEVFEKAKAPRGEGFSILFAGQVSLRKSVGTLLEALTLANEPKWELHICGRVPSEGESDLKRYRGRTKVTLHGPLSQRALAEQMRRASVLVLPSVEEAFGLVVPQALQCGRPCIVSNRVGAKDLVRHRENGSVFEARNVDALLSELRYWAERPCLIEETFDWTRPAEILLGHSREVRRA